MTWDWKKNLQVGDARPEAPGSGENTRSAANVPMEPDGLHAGSEGSGDEPGTRRPAGMIWHPAGSRGAGRPASSPPELLYGTEYECAFCDGRGQLTNESQCPVCRGVGKVSLTPPVVRCRFCHGRGEAPPRSAVTCPACKGQGFIPVTPPVQICPDCRGRGKQRGRALYCGLCRGAGVITARIQEQGIPEARSEVA